MLNFHGKVALTVSQQKSFVAGYVFCIGVIMINHWLLPNSFVNAFTQFYQGQIDLQQLFKSTINEQNLMLLFLSLVKKFATELKLIYLRWNLPRSEPSFVPGRDPQTQHVVFVSHHLFCSYFNRRRQIKDGNFKITFDDIALYYVDCCASTGRRGYQGKVYLNWH